MPLGKNRKFPLEKISTRVYGAYEMLTKSDLSQIRKVIREEVENEAQSLKDELQSDITMSRIRVQNDIGELKDRIKNLEIRVAKMHKELKNEKWPVPWTPRSVPMVPTSRESRPTVTSPPARLLHPT